MPIKIDTYTADFKLNTAPADKQLSRFIKRAQGKVKTGITAALSNKGTALVPAHLPTRGANTGGSRGFPGAVPIATGGGGREGRGGRGVAAPGIGVNLPAALGLGGGFALAGQLRSGIAGTVAFNKGLVAITKTTGIADEEIEKLGEDIGELTNKVAGLDTRTLLQYGEAAGQVGIKSSANILKFVETLGRLELASDLSGGDAARSLGLILDITNTNFDKISNIASALVKAGNDYNTLEAALADTAAEVATKGAPFGFTPAQSIALATSFRIVGIESAVAGSTVQKVLAGMSKETEDFTGVMGMSADVIRKRVKTEGFQIFNEFLAKLKELEKAGKNIPVELDKLGLSEIRAFGSLGALLGIFEKHEKILGNVTDAYVDNTFHVQESDAASKSYEARITRMSQSFNRLKRTIVEGGLIDAIVAGANRTADMVLEMRKADGFMGGVAIGVGTLTSALLNSESAMVSTVAALGTGAGISWAAKAAWSTLIGLRNFFVANPWGAAITGILLIIAHWEKVIAVVKAAQSAVMEFVNNPQRGLDAALDKLTLNNQARGFGNPTAEVNTPIPARAQDSELFKEFHSPSGDFFRNQAPQPNVNIEVNQEIQTVATDAEAIGDATHDGVVDAVYNANIQGSF